jgi:hypothetical protein
LISQITANNWIVVTYLYCNIMLIKVVSLLKGNVGTQLSALKLMCPCVCIHTFNVPLWNYYLNSYIVHASQLISVILIKHYKFILFIIIMVDPVNPKFSYFFGPVLSNPLPIQGTAAKQDSSHMSSKILCTNKQYKGRSPTNRPH